MSSPMRRQATVSGRKMTESWIRHEQHQVNLNYFCHPEVLAMKQYAPPGSMTILRAAGLRLTKTIDASGVALARDHARYFRHSAYRCSNITDLHRRLLLLSQREDCLIVRGGVKSTVSDDQILRRSRKDGSGTIVDVARSWLMIDLDGADIFLPEDWSANPEHWVRKTIQSELPKVFHRAGVVVQWSSSMQISGGTPKCHLWFWLSRPLFSHEAKAWLRETSADPAVFQPVQEHFTASPVYEIGGDPLEGNRVKLLQGEEVLVPNVIKVPQSRAAGGNWRHEGSQFKRFLWEIGDHDGGRGLHLPIRDACLSFISSTWPSPDVDFLRSEIFKRVRSAELRKDRTETEMEDRLGRGLEHNIETAIRRVEAFPNRYRRTLSNEQVVEALRGLRRQVSLEAPGVRTSFFDAT